MFSSRHLMTPLALCCALAACSFGDPAPPARPSTTPSPTTAPPPKTGAALPDVILITLDTTRADHLATYGYFRHTAPRLEALAAESVVFERLVVPMATTLPTHTSLLTGVYPTEHGILANIEHNGRRFVPTDNLQTVTSWLAGHDYQTGAFVSAIPLNRASGVDQGFQVYEEPPNGRDQRVGAKTADDAIAWLKKATPSPLFMWVHFYDPHNPFNPPEAYKDLYSSDEDLERWIDERQITKVARRPTGGVVRAKKAINLYDAEIRYMDDQVGRVLDALEARGRLDSSLVIVMGDHGEGLNQHGQPGHGLVWHEQLHAPLFIKAPGVPPGRVSGTVSTVDVLPTALAMVDLPDEQDLLSQMSGVDARSELTPDRWVMSQTSQRQLMFGRPMTYTLTNDTWKCSWSEGGPVQLWNHAEDPYELTDVADAHPEVATSCGAALQIMLTAHQARATQLGAGETTEMSDEDRAALKALGYLEDDAEAP